MYSSQQHQRMYLCLLGTTSSGPSLLHLHVCLTHIFTEPPINSRQSSRLAHPFSSIVLIGVINYGLLALYRALTCPDRFGTRVTPLSSFSSRITVCSLVFAIVPRPLPSSLAICLLSMHTYHLIPTSGPVDCTLDLFHLFPLKNLLPFLLFHCLLSVWWVIPEELGVGETRNNGGEFSEGGRTAVLTSPDYTHRPIVSISLHQLLFLESTHHLLYRSHATRCHCWSSYSLFGFRDS